MAIGTVVPAAVSVVVPFTFCPAMMVTVVHPVVIALAIVMVFAVSATICPCVAAQRHYKSNQNDAYQYELPCHVNLLCIGLKPDSCGLFNPHDESDHTIVYMEAWIYDLTLRIVGSKRGDIALKPDNEKRLAYHMVTFPLKRPSLIEARLIHIGDSGRGGSA
jgi:hypothetical protein